MLKFPKQNDLTSCENQIYLEFEQKAEQFVSKLIKGYKPVSYNDIKVIHDPVWGTIKFYPWELQLLDSPLLQRLRNINQLGLAVLTYPSAHHSRFEHTLGVAALITKMVDSINDGYISDNTDEYKKIVSSDDFNRLRLAAILHDVGHCFFSHLSETMYGGTEEFKALKSSFEIFSSAQPHEILAYTIINTPSFKKFFVSLVAHPFDLKNNPDAFFDNLGRMIVGAPIDEVCEIDGKYIKKYYLTEMINGQFDADSLDYLRRDSYITGLSLTYHIDRFLYKIKIVKRKEQLEGKDIIGMHFTVPISGISTVEEMIFGKQMLTRYIYQHQKVLAADALVYDVVGGLRANGKLNHPCDFLYYCDDDIYKIYNESADPDFLAPVSKMQVNKDSSKSIADVVKQIKNRDLPKKALVLNLSNISEINGKKDFTMSEAYDALKLAMSHGFRRAVRDEARKICRKIGVDEAKVDLFDIFFAVPKPTTAKNYTDVFVATHDGQFAPLSQVANLNDWAGEFSRRSWNVYVYSYGELLPVVGIAARNVLCSKGICLYNEKIFENLKHSEEIYKILEHI